MPNLDGTGPEGKGELTGRKRGKCKGAKVCPEVRNRAGCRRMRGARRCLEIRQNKKREE